MKWKKRPVISLVVTALALGGLWFWSFYFTQCCAPRRRGEVLSEIRGTAVALSR
jgi:hypothetical protein